MKKCILIVFVLSAKIIIVRKISLKRHHRVLQPDGVFYNMKLEKIIMGFRKTGIDMYPNPVRVIYSGLAGFSLLRIARYKHINNLFHRDIRDPRLG